MCPATRQAHRRNVRPRATAAAAPAQLVVRAIRTHYPRRHGDHRRNPRPAPARAGRAARLARHAARARGHGQGARRAARGRARPAAQLLRGAHVPRRRRERAHADVRPRVLDPAQPQRPDAARRPAARARACSSASPAATTPAASSPSSRRPAARSCAPPAPPTSPACARCSSTSSAPPSSKRSATPGIACSTRPAGAAASSALTPRLPPIGAADRVRRADRDPAFDWALAGRKKLDMARLRFYNDGKQQIEAPQEVATCQSYVGIRSVRSTLFRAR